MYSDKRHDQLHIILPYAWFSLVVGISNMLNTKHQKSNMGEMLSTMFLNSHIEKWMFNELPFHYPPLLKKI